MKTNSRFHFVTQVLLKHIPRVQRGTILDLGSGDGQIAAHLQKLTAAVVTAVDVSPQGTESAKTRGVHSAVWGEALAYCRLAEPQSFNAVLMIDLIEHLSPNCVLTLLLQVRSLLVADGVLLIHTPNPNSPFFSQPAFGDISHTAFWSVNELHSALLRAGFCSVRSYEDSPIIHGPCSAARSFLWAIFRLGLLAVTSLELPQLRGAILTRNYLTVAKTTGLCAPTSPP